MQKIMEEEMRNNEKELLRKFGAIELKNGKMSDQMEARWRGLVHVMNYPGAVICTTDAI